MLGGVEEGGAGCETPGDGVVEGAAWAVWRWSGWGGGGALTFAMEVRGWGWGGGGG